MGGKKKEAQRTKGNVKPASSGHAARLLEASGGFQTGFVGFDSFSGDLGYVPANLQTSEASECGDGELRMVMKRLTKRDAVTKLKALQSFSDICQERDSEVVTDALKYWPRLYSKLAIDYDHRVREAAHRALKEVATRSGRNLAPHLKHLIGAWLLSFCDSHAPAASAAITAFNTVFPTEVKQREAVVYCHGELMKFLSEMLFTATPQTLSDAKTTPPEEMHEKYERILSSSLLCLRLIIKMCPENTRPDLSKKCAAILEQSAFWKFCSHSNRTILPELANERGAKICPVVLSNLGETDPVICSNLWEAVEWTTTNIKEFWLHVNLRKAMLPGLWSSMKKGFDGNAAVAAPKLCGILTNLHAEATGSSREFYTLFFTNMKIGMAVEEVQRSMKEVNSLLSAYHHCLTLVVSKCVEDDDIALLEDMVENQLLSVLEESLLQPGAGLSKSTLYHEFARFVTGLGTKQEKKSLSSRFVSLLKSLLLLEDDDQHKPATLRSVGFSDKSPKQHSTLKNGKQDSWRNVLHKPKHTLRSDHPELERTVELLTSFCAMCLGDEKQPCSNSLRHVVCLCALCGSSHFYMELAKLLDKSSPASLIDVCHTLMTKSEVDWLDLTTLMILITEYTNEEQTLKTLVKLSQGLPMIRGYNTCALLDLLTLVLSADWLEISREAWLNHAKFAECTRSVRHSLLTAMDAEILQEVKSGLSFFTVLLNAHKPDVSLFVLCSDILERVVRMLAQSSDHDVFNVYCDFIDTALHHRLPVDLQVLTVGLFHWLASNQHKESGFNTALKLLQRVVKTSHDDLSAVIESIRSSLDTVGSDFGTVKQIASICSHLSAFLPENFVDIFIDEVVKNIDDLQLFKWLSLPAMKGLITLEDSSIYTEYKLSDVSSACPLFINYIVFASTYLTQVHQEVCSISHALHGHIATAHTWLSFVINHFALSSSSSDSLVETLISHSTLLKLEHWLSDEEKNKSTCVHIMNTSETMMASLAIHALASRLPKDANVVLASQATFYLSSFETLSQAKFLCLNTISHHLCSTDSADLMELLATRIVSTRTESIDASLTGITGLVHLMSVLLARLEETEVNNQVIHGVLDHIITAKAQSPHQLISEACPYMAVVDGSRLNLNVSLMRYFSQLVGKCSQRLTTKHWDLVLCTLDAWVGENKTVLSTNLTDYHSQLYMSNVTSLISVVGNLMKNSVTKQPGNYPADFLSEWAELHALSIYLVLVPYFVTVSGSISKAILTIQQNFVLSCLSNAVTHCPAVCMKKHQLPIKLVPDSAHLLPANHESALNHIVPLLLSPCPAIQSASYILLNDLMSALPQFDKKPLADDTEGRCPPVILMSMLDHCGGQLLSLVGGARIGVDKPLQLLPNSDELCCVRAFLLTWKILLRYLQYSDDEQMAEYSYHLKQNHYSADLLLVLFNIIPLEEPLPNDGAFTFVIRLDLAGAVDMNEVVSIGCTVYYNLIKILPAVVRTWYTDLEKRANMLLARFTAKYVSPRLCVDEMEQIQTAANLSQAENLSVKVRPTPREIIATYTLEEFSIELLIILPSDYPVGLTTVECSKKLGVATNEWRKWMLQLTTFLTYQNGSVANAITLWKKNLDKKFEGVEECYICFSVLHGTNLQLPKQQCKTCKKKFHSACLYKWFTSSQKSTCPLCRNLF